MIKISDAILDEFLRGDADSRVAVETMTTTDFVGIAGEVTSKASFDIEQCNHERQLLKLDIR